MTTADSGSTTPEDPTQRVSEVPDRKAADPHESPIISAAATPGGSGDLIEDEPPKSGTELEVRRPSHLDRPRQWIVLGLLGLISVLSLLIILTAFFASDSNYEQVKELAPIVFSPLMTLLVTAVAWFYASEKRG